MNGAHPPAVTGTRQETMLNQRMTSPVQTPVLEPISDEELARQAGTGSQASFEQLISKYAPRLLQFLRKRLPTDEDAEDVVQETFIKAFRYIGNFKVESKFSTWLYTIAARLAVSHYRSARWKMSMATDSLNPNELGVVAKNDDRMIKEQELENVWNAAQSLKKEQYEVLWLRYGEEMTGKEIADVLEKSQVAVRVLLHRARSKLTGLMPGA